VLPDEVAAPALDPTKPPSGLPDSQREWFSPDGTRWHRGAGGRGWLRAVKAGEMARQVGEAAAPKNRARARQAAEKKPLTTDQAIRAVHQTVGRIKPEDVSRERIVTLVQLALLNNLLYLAEHHPKSVSEAAGAADKLGALLAKIEGAEDNEYERMTTEERLARFKELAARNRAAGGSDT
jgi:hypothetical protein